MKEIIAAAKASHAHSFIKRLPDGYDTVIGEDGGKPVPGDRSSCSVLRRVMLCQPPMLILDEATSSIDTRTEIKIQRCICKIDERTGPALLWRIVCPRFRMQTVILVMKDGSIIEQGNHEELLEQKGFYYKLYNSQFAH